MKRLLLLLCLLTPFARTQSDCGNCWVAGQACGYAEECILGGIPCQQCTWLVICDDPSCNYFIGPQCVCLASNQNTDKKCLTQKAEIDVRNHFLRQKEVNRRAVAHT